MEETERLIDKTGSTLERALLQEGRDYSAPDAVRVHTLAAVGLAASAGMGAGLLAWFSAKSLAAKLTMVLTGATAIAVPPVAYFLLAGDTPVTPPESPAPAVVVTPAVAQPVVPTLSEATVPVAPPVRAPSPSPAPSPARASLPGNSALRAELAALDAIRSSLAQDDPAGALSFVSAYFRTFPRGRLQLEAEVLRIDALAKAGRSRDAERRAQEFIRQHPNSVLSARVRPYTEN